MASADIANLVLRIESLQAETATKRLRTLTTAGDKAERATDRLGRSSKGMALSMIKGGLAIAGVTSAVLILRQQIGALVTTTAKFEKSMSGVRAVTRATDKDMLALTKQAKLLGSSTQFSASQAADGMRFLGQAGFDTNEILESMPGLLDLAAAGMLDLGRAADIASNILSGFNLDASESSRVADVLATTASSANTSVEQLGEGMKFVAPIAAAMGISIEEASAAMGVLSDAGIQGGMAGTGLRRVLSSLADITPAAEKALKAYGLTIHDVNPEINSITDIVDKFADAGLGAADAFKIFGDRGAPAILALTSQRGRLAELNEEMKNSAGRAKEMADVITDNLSGDFVRFTSAVEGARLRLAENTGLTASLRSATSAFTEFFNTVGKSNKELLAETGIEVIAGRIQKLEGQLNRAGRTSKRSIKQMRSNLTGLREAQDQLLKSQTSPLEIDKTLERINTDIDNARLRLRKLADNAEAESKKASGRRSSGRNTSNILSETRTVEAELERLQLQQKGLEKLRSTVINTRDDFGFKVAKDIEKAEAEINAVRSRILAKNVEFSFADGISILPPTEQQEKELDILEKKLGLLREQQDVFADTGFDPATAAQTAIAASIDKANAEEDALVKLQGLREANLESVRDFLKTETQLVNEEFDARIELVKNNTEEEGEIRADLVTQLNERRREQLDLIKEEEEEERDLKLERIQEEFMTELELLQIQQDAKKEIVLASTLATEEEKRALIKKIQEVTDKETLKIEQKRQKAFLSSTKTIFDGITKITEGFSAKQGGIMSALFGVSKAFSIAQATINIAQTISSAAATQPFFPAGLAAIATAISQTAGIVSSIQGTSFSAREHGGLIGAGAVGLVGEAGPELISGPAAITSARTTADKAMRGVVNKITVINNAGVDVNVEESGEGETKETRIMIETAKAEIRLEFSEDTLAGDIASGQGILNQTLESTFDLRRNTG